MKIIKENSIEHTFAKRQGNVVLLEKLNFDHRINCPKVHDPRSYDQHKGSSLSADRKIILSIEDSRYFTDPPITTGFIPLAISLARIR